MNGIEDNNNNEEEIMEVFAHSRYGKIDRRFYRDRIYTKGELVQLGYKALLKAVVNWNYIKKRSISNGQKIGDDGYYPWLVKKI